MPESARTHPFSWINPKPLWRSRNDRLARHFGDPTNEQRRAWMRQVARTHGTDLLVDRGARDAASFVVLGDTGEGDASQWAVLPVLGQLADKTEFMFIASDVVYPAGGVNDYDATFYRPYATYPHQIFAVPGNHDWYDGLDGFMFHLCGQTERPQDGPAGPAKWLGRRLWYRPKRVDAAAVGRMRARRPDEEQRRTQPGPYFVLDTGPLQLVGIDTGITSTLDADQGAWLRSVSSASPKPKILITGKPIYVDNQHHPGEIEGTDDTVDKIVRAREHNYIAAFGGDIHNYQRYPVTVEDDRVIQYVVTGGGGAFMHATHTIPRISLPGVTEAQFRCYPLRGDSLSLYSQIYAGKLRWLPFRRRRYFIEPKQAAAYMAQRLGLTPAKSDAQDVEVTEQTTEAADRIFPKRGPNEHGLLQPLFSELYDWNKPPLFKHLLHVEATSNHVEVRCLAATGCVGDERRAPEDEFHADLQPDGRWRWAAS